MNNDKILIFDGCLSIDDDAYMEFTENDSEQEIKNLDEPLTYKDPISFKLSYPFERSYENKINGNATLRKVIMAIRKGYHEMYKTTFSKQMIGMYNSKIISKYGTAYHCIGDLVIEVIYLDPKTGSLDIHIGS